MIGSAARQYENVILGFATEDHFLARNYGHLALLETPGGSEFWHFYKESVPPEFRDFVSRKIKVRAADQTGKMVGARDAPS